MSIVFSSIFRKSSCENDDTIVYSSFVVDVVADVSLESGSIVGDFFLFVIDDGKRCFVFDVIGSSNMAFIRILWWLQELNCGRRGFFV